MVKQLNPDERFGVEVCVKMADNIMPTLVGSLPDNPLEGVAMIIDDNNGYIDPGRNLIMVGVVAYAALKRLAAVHALAGQETVSGEQLAEALGMTAQGTPTPRQS